MIFERLDLLAFGKFTNLTLDFRPKPQSLHIVYGPNESGKSTSLRAITSFLYGMPNRTTDNYLHPNAKMRIGARLQDDQGNVLECIRRKGRKDTLRDIEDKAAIDESQLSRMLSGIQRDAFEQRFGLSHDELVRGGAEVIAGGGDLGNLLFAASAGVAQLRDIQDELTQAMSKLYIPRGKNASVNQLLNELSERKKQLRETQTLPSEFNEHTDRLAAVTEKASQLKEQLTDVTTQISHLRAVQRAIPLTVSYREVTKKLDEFQSIPELDEGFTSRRRAVDTDREVALRKQTELERRQEQIRDELQSLTTELRSLEHEAEINHLYETLGARVEANRNQKDLIQKRDNINRRMINALKELNVHVLNDGGNELDTAIDHSIDKVRVGEAKEARIHELARVYEKLVQQHEDALEQHEALTKQIDSMNQRLDESRDVADPQPLDQLIDSVGHPDAYLERIESNSMEYDRAKRACEQARRRLIGTELSPKELSELKLPLHKTVEKTAGQIQVARDALNKQRDEKELLLDQQREVANRIRRTKASQDLPTPSDLVAARKNRDELVKRIGGQPAVHATDVQVVIRTADEIADSILANHEKVHRLTQDIAELESLDQQIAECENKLQQRVHDLASADAHWHSIWESLGIDADTPARMEKWVADFESFQVSYDAMNDHKSRLRQAQSSLESVCDRLRRTIASVAPVMATTAAASTEDGLFARENAGIDLQSLYEEALVTRKRLREEHTNRERLTQRVSDLQSELPASESTLENRERQLKKWTSEWRDATASFGDRSTPSVVTRMMSQVQSLMERRHERDVLSKRIRSISEESEVFRSEVANLATQMGLAVGDDESLQMRQIFKQLKDDRAKQVRLQGLNDQLSQIQQETIANQEQKNRCEVVLQQLCAEAKCDNTNDLAATEQKSRERQELKRQLITVREKLVLLNPNAPERLMEEAEKADPSAIQTDEQQLEQEKNMLSESLATTLQELGAIQNQIDLIDGGQNAADLGQTIQEMTGELVRDAEEYSRLKIASMLLQRAIEHYRQENQGPVLSDARTLFSKLTCGEYTDLRVDHDPNGKVALFGVTGSPADTSDLVRADLMSTGTADVLYLALRIAALRHHLSNHSSLPLIVDDCLVQLDDTRAAAALEVFAELANQTQVILFTHHKHLVDLADRNLAAAQFHTHQLGC